MEGKQKLDVRAVKSNTGRSRGVFTRNTLRPIERRATGSMPRRGEKVDPPEGLINVRDPTWKEVKEEVKKERSGSALGPNGIAYIVYKKCPKLLRKVWQISVRSNLEERGTIRE